MSDIASQTLHVVARELGVTLGQARQALEAYADHPEQVEPLAQCAAQLHEVHGVLRVVEVYGAALLAEEMEQVTQFLLETADDRRQQAEGLDALMRSMVQLPAYLERVLGGGRDLALVLLPLLNDLRAVRGSPLLSEGTLLLLNLSSDRQAQPQAPSPGEPPLSVQQWSRRLRTRFQVGLLGWIKGERPEQNLEIIAAVAEKLEQVATSQPVFQLWWVVGAIIEALRDGGLEGSVTLKRLLGQADRELKRLYELSEARYAEQPPIDLLNNLLYYVARATSGGTRVAAVRASFKLQELLPVSAAVEEERENLSAPSVNLMRTVGAAIREDLTRVKDVLDIFVRKGSTQVADLAEQLEMLRKISDTLGVLGLGSLRTRVQQEAARLGELVASGKPPRPGLLVDVAATLIAVEDSLDDALVRLVMPNAPAAPASPDEPDAEFRHVQEAVLRECIVNLARIKEAIAATVARQPGLHSDAVPALARGITAGLLMLGKGRAVEVLESLSREVDVVLQPGVVIDSSRLDRLADAIVSIEYYMETLESGRSDPWYMLDNAEACLRALAATPALPEVEGGDVPVADHETYAATLAIAPPLSAADIPVLDEALIATSPSLPHIGVQPAAAASPVTGAETGRVPRIPAAIAEEAPHIDPDLVELFIEEAREEIAVIEERFPVWAENPAEQDALVRTRRAFHTLKGSGRMVGARVIGEFAWAQENLINRVLSGTLQRTGPVVEVLRDAVALLGPLVAQLESGGPVPANAGLVAARATALAEGRVPGPDLAPIDLTVARPKPVSPTATATLVAAVPLLLEDAPRPLPPVLDTPVAMPPGGPVHPPYAATEVIDTMMVEAALDAAEAEEAAKAAQTPPAAPAPPPVAAEPAAEPTGMFTTTSTGLIDVGSMFLVDEDPAHGEAVAETPPGELPRVAAQMLSPEGRFVRVTDAPAGSVAARTDIPPPPPRGASLLPDTAEEADAQLAEIYRAETTTHLAALRAYVADCAGRFAPYPVTEALHRACHTLSGASKMAAMRHGTRIAEPLNLYVRKLYDHGVALPEAGRRMLADAVSAMEAVAAHMDESTAFFGNHDELLVRLQWLHAELDREIAARGLKPQSPGDDNSLTNMGGDGNLAGQTFMGELMPIDAMLDAPPPAPPPPALPPAARVVPLAPPAAPPPLQPDEDFDAEIAAIFSEEATELLEAADGALRDWRASPNDAGRLSELKRALHTLKGGARMAGLRTMGDLGHEVETLLQRVETGQVKADAGTMDVLQQSLDELGRMRDAVSAGRAVPAAPALVAAVAALSRGEALPTATPIATPVAPAEPAPVAAAPPPKPVPTPVAPPEPPVLEIAQVATPPVPPVVPPVPPVAEVPRVTEVVARPAAPTLTVVPPPAPPVEVATEAAAEDAEEAPTSMTVIERAPTAEPRPAALPPGRDLAPAAEPRELARVDAELLDTLLNNAGEVSILRARLEQQLTSVEFNLAELSRVTSRLKEQLRNLELETEAQILARHETEARRDDFDPLEMDRYSSLQQYSRALAESASDVASVQGLIEQLARDGQNLLMQQARSITELQNGLMRTRMIPFQRHVPRLQRLVRQVAQEMDKKAEIKVSGASGELDRQVLERLLGPFEHLLRNAVVHGLEAPAERKAAGKPATGRIDVSLRRENSEMVIVVADDGAGMNLRAIRERAQAQGMVPAGAVLTDEQAMQLVLESGFSTATSLTQSAGRGVGMDVVATEIKKLGGSLQMESTAGKGARFTMRLPFTLAISQALIVRAADEMYALPLPTVEGVVRLSKSEVVRHLAADAASFDYGGQKYRFQHLGLFIGGLPAQLPETDVPVPVILVRAGEHSTGLVVDELVGNREVVVKAVGPQVAGIRGIAGATILGDGRIVLIMDMPTLVRSGWRQREFEAVRERADRRTFALVVDDSITVRRVTQRLLERNGMRVATARDGVDALALLQDHIPDIILMDIEMPRMDGYELAAQVRGDPRLRDVPIVMITSRVGDKHRARAIEIGVDDYLGKPYQENQLLDAIEPLVRRRRDGEQAGYLTG